MKKMKRHQKIWLLFATVIYFAFVTMAVEAVSNRFPIFGLALLTIGVVGVLGVEITLEMN